VTTRVQTLAVAAEHLCTWLADSPFGIRETTRS